MPKARAKRSGRYTYGRIEGNVEKEIYLKNYYAKHKRAVDAAVNAFKKRKNIPASKDNEKIFVDTLKYGKDFGSSKQAKMAVERELTSMRGEDPQWYDAKHAYNAHDVYGDLRRLNKYKAKYNDYKYMDSSGDWGIEGYYETNDPDIIIANKVVYPSEDSPYSYWEYMDRSKVGL